MRNKKLFPLFLAVLLCSPAWANPGKAQDRQPSRPLTIGDLSKINTEIAVLSAEIKRAELQAELAKKKAEAKPSLPPLPNAPASTLPAPLPTSALLTEPEDPPMPVVRGLEGVDGVLRAILVYAGGVSIVAAEGDMVLDGWRVDRITERSVTVTKGKERRLLAFGREVPPAQPGSRPTVVQTVPPTRY